jgi:uncharacterized cupin superfamily protein
MTRKPGKVIRAAQIQSERAAYRQRLNPRSRFEGSELSRPAGMEKLGVSIAWLKPGEESFAFHAHMVEEEWMYMLSGRAVVEMAEESVEVGPGDFVGFPAPGVAHLVTNPFAAECSYLMGGQIGVPLDFIDYPRLGKQYILKREPGKRTAFHEVGGPEHLFGPADE